MFSQFSAWFPGGVTVFQPYTGWHRSPRSSRHQVQETEKLINPPNQFSFHQQAGLSQGSAFLLLFTIQLDTLITTPNRPDKVVVTNQVIERLIQKLITVRDGDGLTDEERAGLRDKIIALKEELENHIVTDE